MIIKRSDILGIDAAILNVQELLESIGFTNSYIYGRLKKTEKNDKSKYEYSDNKTEHKEVFIDDTVGGVIGFVVDERGWNLGQQTANVELIATVRLDKLINFKNLQDETIPATDERVLQTVIAALEANHWLEETTIKTGIEDVFADVDTDKLKHRDMYPWFVFGMTLKLKYVTDLCT